MIDIFFTNEQKFHTMTNLYNVRIIKMHFFPLYFRQLYVYREKEVISNNHTIEILYQHYTTVPFIYDDNDDDISYKLSFQRRTASKIHNLLTHWKILLY